MCEFCSKHGDGQIWYKNAANYSNDLLSDLRRRAFISDFLESTFERGFDTLGRLETIFKKKGHLPGVIINEMINRAKIEHFGQVLPIEEIKALVIKSDAVVRMPCACRWTANKQEVRRCYGVSFGVEPWYAGIDMGYFGKTSDEGLESLKREEAIAQMEQLEDIGAIHTIWTMMTPFIGAICNCTIRDCLAMRTLSSIHVETMARAEYVATVQEGLCTGCGVCETHCQFDAIESMQESGKITARINALKCFGCGLCRKACSTDAISLIQR